MGKVEIEVTPEENAQSIEPPLEGDADKALDTAEDATRLAASALNVSEQSLAEVQELRKEQQNAWQDQVIQTLDSINQQLNQLMLRSTPPVPEPPMEPEPEPEPETLIVAPAEPAQPPPPKRKSRKRAISLRW